MARWGCWALRALDREKRWTGVQHKGFKGLRTNLASGEEISPLNPGLAPGKPRYYLAMEWRQQVLSGDPQARLRLLHEKAS